MNFGYTKNLRITTDLNCMEPGAEVSLIGNFVTSIKKGYVRSRLRGFACACRISTSTSITVSQLQALSDLHIRNYRILWFSLQLPVPVISDSKSYIMSWFVHWLPKRDFKLLPKFDDNVTSYYNYTQPDLIQVLWQIPYLSQVGSEC